jgi:ribosomal protein S14
MAANEKTAERAVWLAFAGAARLPGGARSRCFQTGRTKSQVWRHDLCRARLKAPFYLEEAS